MLCLYLAGNTPVSARAVVNTRRFCEEHLAGRYELEIVDISLHPERVQEAQIIAAPTLVKKLPAARAAVDRRHVAHRAAAAALRPSARGERPA